MPPATADGRTGAAAASCVFWIEGTQGVFATVAEDHGNCSVGSLTHGFKSMEEIAHNADVAALCETGWVTPEAVAKIAVVREKPTSVVYGPLRDMSVEPSVILLRLNGKQQMLLHDAWPGLRFEGKPQCHIIPIAKESGEIAVSVGCMLSRVRTGMSNNEVTCAVPASRVSLLIERLRAARAADNAVAAYAAEDSKRFGNQPMRRGAVLIGVGDTAGAYRSVIGGPDHRLWLSPRRDLCQGVCLQWLASGSPVFFWAAR